MKFGHVESDQLDNLDLHLPEDSLFNKNLLGGRGSDKVSVYIGCAKWGRDEWVGMIYPEGTKASDFLANYVEHFNSIEVNATFYNAKKSSMESWAKIPTGDFKFCPKFPQRISHIKRLKESEESTAWFFDSVATFGPHLGLPFLQMPDNFAPKYFDRLKEYIESSKGRISYAVELRHPEWFSDSQIFEDTSKLFEENNVTFVITDTAGRRDCVHQRLTNRSAFIRFNGYDLHPTDNSRMDEWANRIREWIDLGLEEIYFFLHQQDEKNTVLSAEYMVKKINEVCGLNLAAPKFLNR